MSRDGIGRALVIILAAGAIVAFFTGLGNARSAGDATRWLESWRAIGFVTFAALFGLLAIFPRRLPGIWEIAFANKAALAITAVFDVQAENRADGLVDAALALAIVAAYILTRGWRSWAGLRTGA